jgi:hypothetical protein
MMSQGRPAIVCCLPCVTVQDGADLKECVCVCVRVCVAWNQALQFNGVVYFQLHDELCHGRPAVVCCLPCVTVQDGADLKECVCVCCME